MIAILNEAARELDEDWYLGGCVMPRYQRWLQRRGLIEQVDGRWRMTSTGWKYVR